MNFVKLFIIKITIFIKQIGNFITHYVLPFIAHCVLLSSFLTFPIYLLFQPKPQSLLLLLGWFFILVILRLLILRINILTKIYLKVIKDAKITPLVKNDKLTYIEALTLSCFACDLAFDKTFAIVGCIIMIFIFIFLDIIYNTRFTVNPILHSLTVFIAIIAGFIFIWMVYNYSLPKIIIIFIALLMTIFEHFSYKIKKFDQPLLLPIFTSLILSFFNFSVIT